MKHLKVLRFNDDRDSFAIVVADDIENIDLSEAYDLYGQQWGDEYEGMFVDAITYHDGRNWRTLFIGSNDVMESDLDYLDEYQEKEILALYGEINNYDWEKEEWGRMTCEKGGYKFILSPGGSDSWNVVRVEENY